MVHNYISSITLSSSPAQTFRHSDFVASRHFAFRLCYNSFADSPADEHANLSHRVPFGLHLAIDSADRRNHRLLAVHLARQHGPLGSEKKKKKRCVSGNWESSRVTLLEPSRAGGAELGAGNERNAQKWPPPGLEPGKAFSAGGASWTSDD